MTPRCTLSSTASPGCARPLRGTAASTMRPSARTTLATSWPGRAPGATDLTVPRVSSNGPPVMSIITKAAARKRAATTSATAAFIAGLQRPDLHLAELHDALRVLQRDRARGELGILDV